MVDQCSGTNKDGSPCSARAVGKTGFCPWHDPAREADRIKWRTNGGHGKSNRARAIKRLKSLHDIADMQAVLMEAFMEVRNGKLEPRVLTALATGARAILDVAGVATYDEQLADMRREIADLRGAS